MQDLVLSQQNTQNQDLLVDTLKHQDPCYLLLIGSKEPGKSTAILTPQFVTLAQFLNNYSQENTALLQPNWAANTNDNLAQDEGAQVSLRCSSHRIYQTLPI